MAAPVGLEAAGAGASGAGSKLEHAYLLLFEPSKDGSLAKPGPEIGRIAFQFNPTELALEKAATWTRPTNPGNRRSSPPQFQGPAPSRLSLEMFFDASQDHDDAVVKAVEKLFTSCVPTSASHDQRKDSPPWVLFRWGSLTGFLAYISSVQVRYTLFTSSGLPIRAVCTATLEEIAGEAPRQNPTSGGLVPHREHTVVHGETLAGIAYREYGDPALWRAVAEANGIDDPFRLGAGDRVLLPAAEDLRDPAIGRRGAGVVAGAR
ncbi:LysM peptidoglycan-binding domain-containing protein [Cellulosimicrobium arenosum]|uniref:LysM peptidoglycan-binding domain-containing protein n=1 Tax=Cellulosimicrobium arenosum TaxID=2708133 RepID=A0A927PFN4_9MICO|nr:LysM peptidoglycan-binding domain-containing protein [Cellulosimicrobium arenosum]MBD8080358.1 LysM peptidoglycan-binding domain-containing protein [Cellulosimicrobium arenosum]